MMQIEIPAFQELALGFARSEVKRIGALKVWPLSICRGTKLKPCGNRPDPAAYSAGVSSSQDDRPYEIGEFNVLDYSEHSAFDSRITQWQLVLDLFAQDVPVT